MKWRDLQKLAKENGVKANMKRTKIISKLIFKDTATNTVDLNMNKVQNTVNKNLKKVQFKEASEDENRFTKDVNSNFSIPKSILKKKYDNTLYVTTQESSGTCEICDKEFKTDIIGLRTVDNDVQKETKCDICENTKLNGKVGEVAKSLGIQSSIGIKIEKNRKQTRSNKPKLLQGLRY